MGASLRSWSSLGEAAGMSPAWSDSGPRRWGKFDRLLARRTRISEHPYAERSCGSRSPPNMDQPRVFLPTYRAFAALRAVMLP
jgi:hypothetical protein